MGSQLANLVGGGGGAPSPHQSPFGALLTDRPLGIQQTPNLGQPWSGPPLTNLSTLQAQQPRDATNWQGWNQSVLDALNTIQQYASQGSQGGGGVNPQTRQQPQLYQGLDPTSAQAILAMFGASNPKEGSTIPGNVQQAFQQQDPYLAAKQAQWQAMNTDMQTTLKGLAPGSDEWFNAYQGLISKYGFQDIPGATGGPYDARSDLIKMALGDLNGTIQGAGANAKIPGGLDAAQARIQDWLANMDKYFPKADTIGKQNPNNPLLPQQTQTQTNTPDNSQGQPVFKVKDGGDPNNQADWIQTGWTQNGVFVPMGQTATTPTQQVTPQTNTKQEATPTQQQITPIQTNTPQQTDNPFTSQNPYLQPQQGLQDLAQVYPQQTGINQATPTFVNQNTPEQKTATAMQQATTPLADLSQNLAPQNLGVQALGNQTASQQPIAAQYMQPAAAQDPIQSLLIKFLMGG